MLSDKAYGHLGRLCRLYSDNPQRDLRLMVDNLKLLKRENRRTVTKIELSRLEKLKIETNEI